MTFIVAMSIGLIVVLALSGIILYMLLRQHSRAQFTVDTLALTAARSINVDDRVGQFNHLSARSRELVYLARERSIACDQDDLRYLAPLTSRLLHESYAGHELVEKERKNLADTIKRDLRKVVDDYSSARSLKSNFLFPWLKTFEPEIVSLEIGRIREATSNIVCLQSGEELAEFDRHKNYIDRKTNLYNSCLDLPLPEPDNILHYRFAPVSANVQGVSAPPRIASPARFESMAYLMENGEPVKLANPLIPQSVRIVADMDVSLDAEALDRNSIGLVSVGVGAGAHSIAE